MKPKIFFHQNNTNTIAPQERLKTKHTISFLLKTITPLPLCLCFNESTKYVFKTKCKYLNFISPFKYVITIDYLLSLPLSVRLFSSRIEFQMICKYYKNIMQEQKSQVFSNNSPSWRKDCDFHTNEPKSQTPISLTHVLLLLLHLQKNFYTMTVLDRDNTHI